MDNLITKEQIVERIEKLNGEDYSRELNHEVEDLKSEYYKRGKESYDIAFNQFIEEGGEKEEFSAPEDLFLERFKNAMATHKSRKEAFNTALEKTYKENREKKKVLLIELKALTEKEELNKEMFEALASIQEQWNEIKELKESDAKELWGEYNYLRDVFYSNVKINHELRELDFQKNLDAKKALIENVKTLSEEESIQKMNDLLQYYHEQWREIGPVKREVSEDMWQEFSEASKVVHKKRQDYYDALYAQEEINKNKKIAICEKIEAIETNGLDTVKQWMIITDELLVLQEEFKKIGFAGKSDNQDIWDRYRKACDLFFDQKSEFFSSLKAVESKHRDKKMSIIEKAEALQNSEDWSNTTNTLITLQRQWKEIGDAGRNAEFKLWKRFRAACDHFFDKKKAHFEDKNKEEVENLDKKNAIIEQLKAFQLSGDKNKDVTSLKEIAAEWNAVGHVPFKDKDKLFKSYKTLLDKFFDDLKLADTERMLTEFKSKLGSGANEGIQRERKKLRAQLNDLKSSLDSLNTNMAMISKSRSADLFRKEVEKQKAKIENDIANIQDKLDVIKQIENDAKPKKQEVKTPEASVEVEESITEEVTEEKSEE